MYFYLLLLLLLPTSTSSFQYQYQYQYYFSILYYLLLLSTTSYRGLCIPKYFLLSNFFLLSKSPSCSHVHNSCFPGVANNHRPPRSTIVGNLEGFYQADKCLRSRLVTERSRDFYRSQVRFPRSTYIHGKKHQNRVSVAVLQRGVECHHWALLIHQRASWDSCESEQLIYTKRANLCHGFHRQVSWIYYYHVHFHGQDVLHLLIPL